MQSLPMLNGALAGKLFTKSIGSNPTRKARKALAFPICRADLFLESVAAFVWRRGAAATSRRLNDGRGRAAPNGANALRRFLLLRVQKHHTALRWRSWPTSATNATPPPSGTSEWLHVPDDTHYRHALDANWVHSEYANSSTLPIAN